MAYLAIDLGALKRAPGVAGSLGVSVQQAVGGLALMWSWAWEEKTEHCTDGQVRGFLACEAAQALIDFGFLEREEDGRLRIKGAQRYLRISEANAEAGKKRAATANRDSLGRLVSSSAPPARASPATSAPPALSQPLHRTPNTEHRTEESTSTTLSAKADHPAFDFVETWNRLAHPLLPRCAKLTAKRQTALKARLKDYGQLQFEEAIARVGASAFCRGGGSTGWVASPDWILQPDVVTKILEGKYDDREKPVDATKGVVRAENQVYPPAGRVRLVLGNG